MPGAIDIRRTRLAGAACLLLALAAALGLTSLVPAEAEAASKRVQPLKRYPRAAIFAPRKVDPSSIRKAKAFIRHRERGRLRRSVPAWRVRRAVDRRTRVRIRVPRRAGKVRLAIKLRGPGGGGGGGAGSPGTPGAPLPAGLSALDDCTDPDVESVWGLLAAQDHSRHVWHPNGGPGGGPYREYIVHDGDNALGKYGERTEAGKNNTGETFALYREGERKVTEFWIRLPDRSMVDAEHYAIFMQQKQTQPSPDGGGSPVIALAASGGKFRLRMTNEPAGSENSEVWSVPAQTGVWLKGFTDVTYSSDPSKGTIQVGIGDAVSPVFHRHTLKRDRYGDSIPGHLRLGVYRDDSISNTSRVELGPVSVSG